MLIVQQDYRLGNIPRPYVTNNEKDINMQIPDEIRKCVVFLAYKTTKGYQMVGTGFFCGIDSDDKQFHFRYLVTAKHVLAKIQEQTKEDKISVDNNIWVRVNKKDGNVDYIPVPFNLWLSHPDISISVDIIACLDILNPAIYDYLTIPYTMFATKDVMDKEYIGIGDEIFMTGLFINHYGKKRNIPIIRVGNIAALDEEPIHASKFGDMDAYLVETRSIGGLSGSPVFVHLSGSRISTDGNTTSMRSGHIFYLFGLMHGHWDLSAATEDVITEDVVSKERVNMGIGIVVPFSKIWETLNQDIFKNNRESIILAEQKRRQPVEDSIKKVPAEFDRLIDKAIECSPKDD